MTALMFITFITLAICPATLMPVLLITAFVSWLARRSGGYECYHDCHCRRYMYDDDEDD